jgi:hypothetical protein
MPKRVELEGTKTMIRNLLIAASAAAVLATVSASTASAKIHLNVNLGLVAPGFAYGEPYPYYPVVDSGYDDGYGDCGFEWVSYKKWNPWHTAFVIKHHKVWTCN